jgi:hypothetical protein
VLEELDNEGIWIELSSRSEVTEGGERWARMSGLQEDFASTQSEGAGIAGRF